MKEERVERFEKLLEIRDGREVEEGVNGGDKEASFIFYFVQVHLPETRQKNDQYPVVANLFNRIIITEKGFLISLLVLNNR